MGRSLAPETSAAPCGSNAAHTALVRRCLLALSAAGHMVWPNNTGALRDRSGRLVRYGLEGSADILGVTRDGRFLAVECKTGDARLRPPQRAFRDAVIARGGLHVVARSEADLAPLTAPRALGAVP